MPFVIRDTSRKIAKAAGLRTYRGIPCKRGHDGERYVSSKKCVLCADARGVLSRARNPGRAAAYSAAFRARYPERAKTFAREWARKNSEKQKPGKTRWYREKPHRSRAYAHNRRARKLSAGGTHNIVDIRNIFELQKGRCAYCRISLHRRSFHVDHIEPLSRGGANDRRNLQILCEPCNRSKSCIDPIVYANRIGLLV